jgi:hypothetical protein
VDKSLLVSIFVPTFEQKGRDGQGKVGEVATGYPVGPDLIQVARHVLEPPARDVRYPVEVLWQDYPTAGPNNGWFPVLDEAVVWRGPGKLDAALLRCGRPSEARGWGIVSEEPPQDGLTWVSAAFPRSSRYGGDRHPTSFGGVVHSMSPNSDYFEVEVRAPPDTDEGWHGASGMPVFVGRKILGILQEVPRHFRGHLLHAVPSWKLLKDAGFRATVGYDAQLERRRRCDRRLTQILKSSPVAVEALERESGLQHLSQLDPGAKAEDAARRLLETDIDSVIEGLAAAYRWVRDEIDVERSAELTKAEAALAEAAQLILPALFDLGVVAWARGQGRGPDAALVVVPACLRTVAEIIMAGVDDRPTRYRPRTYDLDNPAGEFSLPTPPEPGLQGVSRFAEELERHLCDKFLVGSVSDLEATIHDYLVTTFYRPEAGSTRDVRQQRASAAINIEALGRHHRRTYYMMFPVPHEDAARNEVDALVRRLKEQYPAITFLALNDDGAVEQSELRRFGPFRFMLPKKQG